MTPMSANNSSVGKGDEPIESNPCIVTSCDYPPIPDRRFDWCAYREGNDEAGPRGWGRTEREAIADLLQIEAWDRP